MKILLLGDVESQSLWDYFDKSKIAPYSLILSSGDLRGEYLSFLATFTSAPILYVHGNHDTRYSHRPPEGCVCIEDQVFEFHGIRILGLGGSMRYRPGDCQYSEKEMGKRIAKLKRALKKSGGFDILLTHSPAYGIGDASDLPHQGFQCFLELLDHYHPSLFIHGHVHANYTRDFQRVRHYKDTTIVNSYERWEVEYPLTNSSPNASF